MIPVRCPQVRHTRVGEVEGLDGGRGCDLGNRNVHSFTTCFRYNSIKVVRGRVERSQREP